MRPVRSNDITDSGPKAKEETCYPFLLAWVDDLNNVSNVHNKRFRDFVADRKSFESPLPVTVPTLILM